MQEWFDYIFYRIYCRSRDRGDSAAETNGSLLLSAVQFFTLLDLTVFLRLIFNFPLPPKWIFILIAIAIAAYNWFRYEQNVQVSEFEKKWGSENEKERERNRWWINFYMGASFAIILIYGLIAYG